MSTETFSRSRERAAVAGIPTRRLNIRVALPAVCVLLDVTLIIATVLLAAGLRTRLTFLANADDVNDLVTRLAIPFAIGWVLALTIAGTYRPHQLSAGIDEYKNVVNASAIYAGIVGIACFIGKVPLSRAFFLIAFALGVPALVLGRAILRRGLHSARRHGLFLHRLLVAGTEHQIDEISRVMRRESWLGYEIIGALRPAHEEPTADGRTSLGVPYVGVASEAAHVTDDLQVDTIIMAAGAYAASIDLRRAQWALEDRHVQVIVAPGVTDVARERVRIRPVAGLPLVHLERPQVIEASRWAKRAFDLLGASLALLVLWPLLLAGILAVRLHDGGPVFFRQRRIGRDGEAFEMLKLRSMVTNAEELLDDLVTRGHGNAVLFKMSEDPRITRPGQWLRRFSIDELPQLFNVLRGEMSLVGPRPALPVEVSRYSADVNRRLRVRPGMTGLWQVSGRSDLSWEDTVRLDLYYVDNWSILQDLSILARTLRAVVGSDGAY